MVSLIDRHSDEGTATTADVFLDNATIRPGDEMTQRLFLTASKRLRHYLGWHTDADNGLLQTDKLSNRRRTTCVSSNRMRFAHFTAEPPRRT